MPKEAFDFYSKVNKDWLASTNIPDNASSYSVFDILEKKIQKDLVSIIKKNKEKNSNFGNFIKSIYDGRDNDIQFINTFYNSLSVKSYEDLFYTFGLLNVYGLNSPVSFEISNDSRNTDRFAIYLDEPKMILLKEEYRSQSALYKKYATFLKMVGFAIDLKEGGADFLKLESELSESYYNYEENFIIEKIYNPMTYKQIIKIYPLLADFFKVFGFSLESINIVVINPGYLASVYKIIMSKPLAFWKKMVKMYIYLSLIEVLPEPFHTLHFDFLYKYMLGQKKEPPLDKLVFYICNDICSDTLGFLYTRENIEEFKNIKNEATKLFEIVMQSAKKSVKDIPWLSVSSRQIAVFKLDKMKHRIGYPNTWLNEFNCPIDQKCFLQNLFSLKKAERDFDFKRLLLTKLPNLWDNPCFTVNAFYYTELNLLCVPLGFLNAPFFSLKQSFVQNLAGLGNIIAHEIAHGFDEEGRKYDEKGNYKPWWTSTDIEMYSVKTRKLIDFFNKEKYGGLKVNGELTLGENLADLGAMAVCLEVLKERHAFTPNIRLKELREFFTWYAKTWIYKETKEKRENALKADRHAPAQVRVNAVIRQFREFYEAFSIVEGDPGWLSMDERIDVWG